MEYEMTDKRRADPSLTEAELARVRAAYPGLEITRDPSGIVIMSRKPPRGDDYADWLLSQRGTVSREIDLEGDRPRIETELHRGAQDTENLRALAALRDRLIRESETSEGAHAITLNVAIRALVSAIDILDSVIAHEQRMPQKVAGRDKDTYDQRREFLNDADRPVEKVLEGLCGDPAKRNLAEAVAAAGPTDGAVVPNAQIQRLELSERDTQVLLEMIANPPAPNEKLKEAMRSYLSLVADSHPSDTQSISEIVDTD
jgi:hypothetical protein